MIVVYNEVTQDHFLRPQFVIFRCQKICKKGYIEMTKKFYLEALKSVLGRSVSHYSQKALKTNLVDWYVQKIL